MHTRFRVCFPVLQSLASVKTHAVQGAHGAQNPFDLMVARIANEKMFLVRGEDTHTLSGNPCLEKKMFWYGDYYRSQINAKPEWNLSKLKFFNELFLRKFKNLAKKLSDFDKNLTAQKTICVALINFNQEMHKFDFCNSLHTRTFLFSKQGFPDSVGRLLLKGGF